MNYLTSAKATLTRYAQAINLLNQRLSDEFNEAVKMILECEGRVVIAGIGKSGLVGKKVFTTPPFFLNAISSYAKIQ